MPVFGLAGIQVTDDLKPFATPTFHGARFAGHRMPVDALPDLVAYTRLIREVARTLYVRSKSRRRLGPNDGDLLTFSVASFGQGSVPAEIVYSDPDGTHELYDYAQEARDLIALTIEQVANEKPIPALFPREHLVLFDKFGKGLREQEWIELRPANDPTGPRYTKIIRGQLLVEAKRRVEQELTLTGAVFEVNTDTKSFQIHLSDHWSVRAHYTEAHHEKIVRAALASTASGVVTIRGLGSMESSPPRLAKTFEIIPHENVGGPDLIERLRALRLLKKGWLEEQTSRPKSWVLDWAGWVLHAAIARSHAPRPHLYPTENAGVQAEWTFGAWEVSATFTPMGVEFHATNTDTGEFEELRSEKDGIDDLCAILSRHVGG